jgi:lysophospholipase L1-like esterase
MKKRVQVIKPGLFSQVAHADTRRSEFDVKNEVIVTNKVPVKFVFIGDSITHNWETGAYFHGDGVIINRGIGGDNSEYMLRRFEADAIQLKPQYIVVLIGINDTWVLDDVNTPNNTIEFVSKKILKNMEKLLLLCKERELDVIICSILPTCIPGNPHNRERNEMIVEINREIMDLCVREEQIYVDYHSSFIAEDGFTLREGLTSDGLHPHVFGYNVMAQVLKETLYKEGISI